MNRPDSIRFFLFSNFSTYQHYCSAFGPAGEEPPSTGQVFAHHYYQHLTVVDQELWRLEPILAYLMVHYILAHRDVPRWLEKGLCEQLSKLYDQGDYPPELATLEKKRRTMQDYWHHKGLQKFWDERATQTVKEAQFTEQLAKMLTCLVLEKVDDIGSLLESISREDAGYSAVLECTGRSLESFVCDILGPGDWGLGQD